VICLKSNNSLESTLVIFGGTGDLTYRKLFPAIYNLQQGKSLPDSFAIVSIGRRDKTNEQYRTEIYESIKKFSRYELQEETWIKLKDRIYYYQIDFTTKEGYPELVQFLYQLDNKYKTNGNRLFYLAVAPEYFGLIVQLLNENGLVQNDNSWQRVIIEKPFGRDLVSAQLLNEQITKVFSEENTYRIDHYLGKEMLQNIMVIRFANSLFEPIWNNKYIDNIQISSSETVGIGDRGGYYEKSGALRDMVQNHMLQLLSLTAMEPPSSLETKAIRNEKVKLLQSIQELTPEVISKNMIRGQYDKGVINGKDVISYKEENRVSSDSNTETFIALKLYINNFRWHGVPFYIRTGKHMPSKSTEVVIQFKALDHVLYFDEHKNLQPNLLVIRIQPNEGVYLQFNGKVPGTKDLIVPVKMDYCQNCEITNNSPEAYERLLLDALKGDSTLFTRWDEVETSWKFIGQVDNYLRNDPSIITYKSGTWGPDESEELLVRDGRKWWNVGGESFNENS